MATKLTPAHRSPQYEPEQIVVMRQGYVSRQPRWSGATGIITRVHTKILPQLKVMWVTGPREGHEDIVPGYMIVPRGHRLGESP